MSKEVSMNVRPIASIALALILAAGCQPAPEVGGLSAEDEAAIRALFANFVEAEKAGDWDAAIGMMTDDVVILPNQQPAIEGRAALREWIAQFPDMRIEELNATIEGLDGRGDLAFLWGKYSETFRMGAMEEPIALVGKFVWIVRRQADGSWRIAVGISNSDRPMEPGGPET